ncbi:threonine transporter RhtB [Glaciecola punicea]|jgi:threonine/homoserine/homoserine lactone efflux protein|nr:LysE family translocator [Glaciecola punicea]OFA31016.1 threonine transporter RhtB [Glaciecola punicea]
MPDFTVLVIFIPTFFLISLTPGMCMSLAMTLGMTIGVKKTLYMMAGEVIGVALVAILAVIGVASIMIQYPTAFTIFKVVGGLYLTYLGIKMWISKIYVELDTAIPLSSITPIKLTTQGFVTAVANPKGWAFMISLLPPFLDIAKPLPIQLLVLVFIIMISELICMLLYANGGKWLRQLLNKSDKAQWVNRIGGGLLVLIGVWLAFS